MADHESRAGESEGGEEDGRARERKEEAKLRGKELGKARALQRQLEREHMEQRRERKLDEERERQKEREQERWRSVGRGRDTSEGSRQRWYSLPSPVEDPASQRAGGGAGDALRGDASRREDLTNTRAVSHWKDVDHEGRRGVKRRWRRIRDGRDDQVDAFSSGGEDACPDHTATGAGRAREGGTSRSREGKSGLMSIERSVEQRGRRKREVSRAGSSSRESRFPRPRPGNTLSIGTSSRHPGTSASWHHVWFQEVLRPQVQGTGTLSSSPVQGMGSGTLAVAATGGRRILPSRGVGTLAVW